MPYITIKNGPDKGKSFKIKDEPITVGRDKNQTIQILDQGVSRSHSEVFKLGELFIIRDLDSTNGTFVNTDRVKEEVIKASDEILIGNTKLILTESPGLPDPLPAEIEVDESDKLHVSTVEIAIDEISGAPRRNATTEAEPPPGGGKVLDSRNLQISFEIGRTLNRCDDLSAGLGDALDTLSKSVEASHGYILSVDLEKGSVKPRIEASRGSDVAVGTRKLSRAIVKHVIKSHRPTLISDAMVDDRFQFSESIVFRKIRSVMCVPMISPTGMDEVIYLHKAEGPAFTVEDLELCSQAALQFSMAMESRRFESTLRRSMDSAVRALMRALEFYDLDRRGHSTRVADSSQAIASQLGLPREEIQKIRLSAHLHDVGKLTVHVNESSIMNLKKPGDLSTLSDPKHIYEGEKIVKTIHGGEDLLPGIKYHHERADGPGFPYKLKNSDTPVMARIIIVANAFDNACEYRKGKPTAKVGDVLRDLAARGGTEFDEETIKALLICHRNDTLYSPPLLGGGE